MYSARITFSSCFFLIILEQIDQVASTGIEFRFNSALTYQRSRNGFTNPDKFDIQMILCYWIIASGIELCYNVDGFFELPNRERVLADHIGHCKFISSSKNFSVKRQCYLGTQRVQFCLSREYLACSMRVEYHSQSDKLVFRVSA